MDVTSNILFLTSQSAEDSQLLFGEYYWNDE